MKLHSQEPVSFDDIKNEIFDMVKPKDPLSITLQDLVKWFECYFVNVLCSVYLQINISDFFE